MTAKRGWMVLLAVAALAVAVVAWWRWATAERPASVASTPVAGGPVAGTGETARTADAPRGTGGTGATTLPSPAAPGAKPAAPQGPTPAYLLERYAVDRTAAFDRLAASDDPAALAAAVGLAEDCVVFSDHLVENTLASIDKRVLPARIKALQKETVEQERGRCAGFDAERNARAARIRRTLAQAGDIRMFAFNIGAGDKPIPEVVATAQRAASSNDPLALQQVGFFFANRNDVAPGVEYVLADGLTVPRNILRDAFWLAACDYGMECGARSSSVATKCVSAGWCGSASLEELFRTYNYPPADAERLEAARQVVLNGVRTGQWPANFWAPPK